ncbi:hypothetical protein NKG95_20510 [Mesorhizobium sp. M1423]|uniref:hypothetical protein n=1 Tax=Mesorhizobium sp. M1423 TaxID=2957101 RepID=UPI0033385969
MLIATHGGASFVNSDHIEKLTLSKRRDDPQRVVLFLFSGEQMTVVLDRAELARLTGEEHLDIAVKTKAKRPAEPSVSRHVRQPASAA